MSGQELKEMAIEAILSLTEEQVQRVQEMLFIQYLQTTPAKN